MDGIGTYDTEPCWCRGECCSDIPLSDHDLRRIEQGTGMRFGDFAVRTNAGAFVKRGPPVYEWRGEGEERMRYVLRFCYFLDTQTRLCRFYGQRASICRDFVHERPKRPRVDPAGDTPAG
jgi:Fe-S-cluster containining protein